MNQQINIGLIGTGYLGKFHLQQIKTIEELNFIGIYDKDHELAQQLGSENDVEVYESAEELINGCDALSIVVPTQAHYETAIKGLEGGCHLFVEKPIASTLEDARDLVQRANEQQLTLQVGHIERFNPAYIAAEKAAKNIKLIEAKRMTPFSNRGSDVSVILDLMIHDIDLCLSLIDSSVGSISASGSRTHTSSIDHGLATITFKNGSIAKLVASRVSDDAHRQMQIKGDQTISLDFINRTIELSNSNDKHSKRSDLSPANPLRDNSALIFNGLSLEEVFKRGKNIWWTKITRKYD